MESNLKPNHRNIIIVGVCLALIIVVAIVIGAASQGGNAAVGGTAILLTGVVFTVVGVGTLVFFMNYDPGKSKKKKKKSKGFR